MVLCQSLYCVQESFLSRHLEEVSCMRHSADSFVGPADGALPDITDGPAAQIREFIANEDHRLRRRYVKELNDSIIGNVGLPASHSCSGAEAAQYIDACINATEAILKARHSAYSPLRWLWYLRRTPDELFIATIRLRMVMTDCSPNVLHGCSTLQISALYRKHRFGFP